MECIAFDLQSMLSKARIAWLNNVRMFKLSQNLALQLAIFVLFGTGLTVRAVGFLHVAGRDIVDEKGQKVLLRGVGLGNWMLPEGYMWLFGSAGDRPRKIENLVRELIGPDNA